MSEREESKQTRYTYNTILYIFIDKTQGTHFRTYPHRRFISGCSGRPATPAIAGSGAAAAVERMSPRSLLTRFRRLPNPANANRIQGSAMSSGAQSSCSKCRHTSPSFRFKRRSKRAQIERSEPGVERTTFRRHQYRQNIARNMASILEALSVINARGAI